MTKTKQKLIMTWTNAYTQDIAYYQIKGGNPLIYIEYTQKMVEDEITDKQLKREILKFLAKEYKFYEKKIQTNNNRNSLSN